MFSHKTKKSVDVFSILREAEAALKNRRFPDFVEAFSDIWADVSKNPDFSGFPYEAKLLHLAGEFLVHYGKAHNLRNFQSRGKDLLTRAIDLFSSEGESEQVLDSQIVLAFSYFNEGAIEEYEAFLLDAESQFKGNKAHATYLKLQINLIIHEIESSKIHEAKRRITENQKYFVENPDVKLKTQFFIEAGITYRRLGAFENALLFFNEALDLAKISGNTHYETLVYNNLAYAYRTNAEFEKAHTYANMAIALAENQPGWKANLLDTKALIYSDQKDFEKAETTINEAISLFIDGEDFGGLCEALWNKVKILKRLDLPELALEAFIECYQTAALRISGDEARRYLTKFAELMPIISGENIFEQMDSLKRHLIEKALIKSNGKITEAAKLLGIDHRTLSAMMKNFPSLYTDLGIKRRHRSPSK